MLVTRFTAFACAALLLSGCQPAESLPAVAGTEVDALLTKAVKLAASKLPRDEDVCFAEDLSPSTAVPADDPVVDGWKKGPSDDVFYRDVVMPARRKLPRQALSGLPVRVREKPCRHPIVFEEPSAVQLRVQQEVYIQIYIRFANRCPACGAGYQIVYRQTNHGWQIEPPGMTLLWIS